MATHIKYISLPPSVSTTHMHVSTHAQRHSQTYIEHPSGEKACKLVPKTHEISRCIKAFTPVNREFQRDITLAVAPPTGDKSVLALLSS